MRNLLDACCSGMVRQPAFASSALCLAWMCLALAADVLGDAQKDIGGAFFLENFDRSYENILSENILSFCEGKCSSSRQPAAYPAWIIGRGDNHSAAEAMNKLVVGEIRGYVILGSRRYDDVWRWTADPIRNDSIGLAFYNGSSTKTSLSRCIPGLWCDWLDGEPNNDGGNDEPQLSVSLFREGKHWNDIPDHEPSVKHCLCREHPHDTTDMFVDGSGTFYFVASFFHGIGQLPHPLDECGADVLANNATIDELFSISPSVVSTLEEEESNSFTKVAGFNGAGMLDGSGETSKFYQPRGITGDTGNGTVRLFICDSGNHRVRLIVHPLEQNASGSYVSTIAGNGDRGSADGVGGNATFHYPIGIVFHTTNAELGSKAVLYVADFGNSAVRKIDVATHAVSTLVISNNASSLSLHGPTFLVMSRSGAYLYVTDRSAYRVVRIFVSSSDEVMIITHIAGSINFSICGDAPLLDDPFGTNHSVVGFREPYGIALMGDDESVLLVSDASSNVLRAVRLDDGAVVTIAGNGTEGRQDSLTPYSVSLFGGPQSIIATHTVSADLVGNDNKARNKQLTMLLVADTGNKRLRCARMAYVGTSPHGLFPPTSQQNGTAVLSTSVLHSNSSIFAIYVHPETGAVYVTLPSRHIVARLEGGTSGTGSYDVIAVAGSDGHEGYADGSDVLFNFTSGLAGRSKSGGAVDGEDSIATLLYVADLHNYRVRVVDLGAQSVTTLAGNGTSSAADGLCALAAFGGPFGVAWHPAANALFVLDESSIRRIDLSTRERNCTVSTVVTFPRLDGKRFMSLVFSPDYSKLLLNLRRNQPRLSD